MVSLRGGTSLTRTLEPKANHDWLCWVKDRVAQDFG